MQYILERGHAIGTALSWTHGLVRHGDSQSIRYIFGDFGSLVGRGGMANVGTCLDLHENSEAEGSRA